MEHLKLTDPELYKAILNETRRQNNKLELIASENFVSLAVLQAAGQVMTNKYAEGYPQKTLLRGGVNLLMWLKSSPENEPKRFSKLIMQMSNLIPVHKRILLLIFPF